MTESKKYDNFDMTLEECRLVFDTFDNLVITDEKGFIKYLSPDMYFMVEAYNKRPVPNSVIGKHISEIHPMSKIMKVLETGKPIKNAFYFSSDVTNIARIEPLYRDNRLAGAIDYDIFTSGQDLGTFLDEVKSNAEKGMLNFEDTFHTMYDSSRDAAEIKYSITDFIGNSVAAKTVRKNIANLSESNSNVLITGNTGCGKEVVAHAIHNTSRRCNKPLIAVNCAAIPDNLIESELFGYVEGAFTGAQKGGKTGLFELADTGTIFLDEINQLPYHIQPKLLRVIQEKEITPIGGVSKPIDARIIAATNKDLWDMVLNNEFREDLFYRLNVMEINIPPLRNRKEDIPLLANFQLDKIKSNSPTPVKSISKEVFELLNMYDWPGNVRELNNLIERSVLLCQEEILKPEHLGAFTSKILAHNTDLSLDSDAPLEEVRSMAEANAIRRVMDITGGNRSQTAKLLKISRTALYDKLKRYGML